MRRALPVLTIFALLLLPAAAGAKSHQVDLEKGEVALSYEGEGATHIPLGEYCPPPNCYAFGQLVYTLQWEATAIVGRHGYIHGGDASLSALGSIGIDPTFDIPPGAAIPTAKGCLNTVRDNRHYADGFSVSGTARSIGVQAELPFSRRWLTVSGDPGNCQMSDSTWAGGVFSLGAGGPTKDADLAKLALAVRPKMGARRTAHTTTRHFDFNYVNDTGTGPDGQYTSKITSTMTIINGCRRFSTAEGTCTSFY